MDLDGMKRRIASAMCLCLTMTGLWAANNKISGRAAGSDESCGSEGSRADVQAVSVAAAAPVRGADRYEAALSAMWSLDQTDLPAEAFAMAAQEAEEAAQEEPEGEEESEYANLAIADVSDYVNVRSLPGTDGEILGKIYDGAVAQILETAGENGEWFHVVSGSVEGYIKAEYFLYGDAAAEVIDDYVTRSVLVKADRLNVRSEADIESKRIGYLDNGEKALLLEDCGEWMKVQYAGSLEGYVAAEYVTVVEEFTYAKSIEEERAEQEALRALQRRQETSEESAPENTAVAPPDTSYATNGELRTEIVNYAMQFLGNKYVHGGNSLTTGTDCSGFTSLIYADFGYSLSRTPSGQYSSAGRAIDYSEIQPGDIICYSSNGGKSCTHVALYIGGGQIIHAANSRKGVVIYEADYDTIIGVRNVID